MQLYALIGCEYRNTAGKRFTGGNHCANVLLACVFCEVFLELDFYFMKAVLLDEVLNALLDTGIEISLKFSPFYFSLMN